MNQVQFDSSLMKNGTALDEHTLVSQLNALLTSLRIPIPLISPTDLTPRLLIAILEAILGMRIPVIERQDDSQLSKVQNMKIFLGVLETDFLQIDVGLSLLDPRRLAYGEREEVTFIAELLCWIGRRMKLIKRKKFKPQADVFLSPSPAPEIQPPTPVVAIPSSRRDSSQAYSNRLSQLDVDAASVFQTGSSWTNLSTSRNNSPFTNRPFENESFTSLNSDDHLLLQSPFSPTTIEASQKGIEHDDSLCSVSDILSDLPGTLKHKQRERPRCIHEIPSPPSIPTPRDELPSTPPRESTSNFTTNWCPEDSTDRCMSNSSEINPPVRYSGYIEPVDEESEVASFELSRSFSTASEQSFDILVQDEPVPALKSVRQQYTRTLELLNERARLLTHLADLKNSDPFG